MRIQEERQKQALGPRVSSSFQDFPLTCPNLESVSGVSGTQAQDFFLCSIARALSPPVLLNLKLWPLRAPAVSYHLPLFPKDLTPTANPRTGWVPGPCSALILLQTLSGLIVPGDFLPSRPQASSWIISGHWCWFLLVQWCQALPVFFLCGLSPCSLIQWCLIPAYPGHRNRFPPTGNFYITGCSEGSDWVISVSPGIPSSRGRNSLLQWITFCWNSSLWPVYIGWPCPAWFIASLNCTSPFATTTLCSMKGMEASCPCC